MPDSPSPTRRPTRPSPLLAAALLALPALPGIGARDPRVVVNAGALPWRAVARVQTETGTRCTGFLIAPRVALTAAHCLLAPDHTHFLAPGAVHVLTGYSRGHFAGHARALSATVPPAYDPAHGKRPEGSDWAVLTLDAPLGAGGATLRLATTLPPPGTQAMLGGYDQDRAEVMTADPDCTVTGRTRQGGGMGLIRDDCAATRGASGAPLIARAPDGGWVALGLRVAVPRQGAGGFSVPAAALDAAP